nr:MAG TPA: hypothetical protein [Caudoviricetes sp.]
MQETPVREDRCTLFLLHPGSPGAPDFMSEPYLSWIWDVLMKSPTWICP